MEQALKREFAKRFRRKPGVFVSAPGRINIIGEHTDYNQGYVLPAAIDRRIYFLAALRGDADTRVYSHNYRADSIFSPEDITPPKHAEWPDYVKGVLWVLRARGYPLKGFDALVSGDIPAGAGLSSSAALEVCVVKGCSDLFHLDLSGMTMATMAQTAENDFVGMKCGLMDPFISVFGRKDHAVFLDCLTLDHRPVNLGFLNESADLFIYDSGIKRRLTESSYNKRGEETAEALKLLNLSGIHSYRDLSLEFLCSNRKTLGEMLFRRARHVVSENSRVLEMLEAVERKDVFQVGALLFRSHESLRDDYEVSCPELDLLYDVIQDCQGGLGARLTGAGFGGSGIALVDKKYSQVIQDILLEEAGQKGYVQPKIYQVRLGQGVLSHRT